MYYLGQKFGHEIKLIAFDKLNYYFLFGALLVFGISQFIAVWRWYICYFALSPVEAINYKNIFSKVYWMGLFSNNFLPSSFGGDLVRAYILKSLIKSARWSYCLVSVFVDRMFGLVILSLLGLGVGIYIQVGDSNLNLNLNNNWLNLFTLVFAGVLIGFIVFCFVIIKFPKKYLNKFTKSRKVRRIVKSLEIVFSNKILLFNLFMGSALIQVLVIVSIYFASLGLNIHIPQTLLLMLNPASTLGTLVIPSINGLGVREGIYAYLFRFFNGSGGEAIILSAFWFITMLIISLPGGIFFLQNKNKKSWQANSTQDA